ncbi:MAG: hypothetical protein JZU47_18900 [Prolixibacteraceae bacterium]|nr:hypothetical protein [Prolixibacteraceae bacterium]
MKYLALLFVLSAFTCCNKEPEKPVIQEPQIPKIAVTADFSNVVSKFDKKKVLNIARGGHGINTDLTWMPGFYDKLAEIGIDEFRLDWVLSDWFYQVVSRNDKGELQYDFAKLDKIILPMVQKGMKPMMCMCYMASALGKNEEQPNNYDEYKSAIKAFVKHYKDLGYTGWAWESHNEPEGFTKLTPAQTYKMYKYFSEGVKEADATARVGGYGSVGHDWIGYANSFLDFYKNDSAKPVMDFFSFHQYSKPSWEYVPEIENAFTSRGLKVPDLYLTEWNNGYSKALDEGNLGVVGGGYDTHVNASYVAKKMYNSLEYSNLKKIYFWNFADADPAKKFGGDMGLFTVDRHRKAAANTFLFYNNLYGSVVSATFAGDGTAAKNAYGIVTVDPAQKKLAMILWNHQFDTFVFNTSLNNLPALSGGQQYTVKKMLVDANNGNYYADFLKGFSGTGVGPTENAKVVKTFKLSGTNVTFADTLKEHSVALFLIEPAQ